VVTFLACDILLINKGEVMGREKSTDKQTRDAMQTAKKLQQDAEAAEKAAEKLLNAASGRAADFMDFVREQGVVGLAVGLAIGTAAGASVKSIVEGFINPIITLIVGSQQGLAAAKWHLEIGGRAADFAWGAVLSSLITLLTTALVIYWVVKVAKLDRIDKKKS
jgi:large-conductance mechanosensitive channel